MGEAGKWTPPRSRAGKACVYIGMAVAIVAFQVLFPPVRGEGFDFVRVLFAGLWGAIGAVAGTLIGLLIERSRK